MLEHFVIESKSDLWYYGLAGGALYIVLILALGFLAKKNNKEKLFSKVLFWFLLLREIVFFVTITMQGKFTLVDSLPLHLCTISYIFCIIYFYNKNRFSFEFLMLLSLGGAIQSLLTPEMTHGYSDYFYVDYYISHCTIIMTPFYGFLIDHYKPRKLSFMWVWLIGHIILMIVGMINSLIGSNYIYLCAKPKVDNAMVDGVFPNHLVSFEVFGTLHIILFYVLFRFVFATKKHTY